MNQAALKDILNYDPAIGVLLWAKDRKKAKAGQPAGRIGPRGYIDISLFGKTYKAHRLIFLWMTGRFPKYQIDHINHDRADNRWENLRESTHAENQKNKMKQKRNKYGVNGLTLRNGRLWIARIGVDGDYLYLGSSEDKDAAIALRKNAEMKYGFHPNHGKGIQHHGGAE